MSHSPDCGCREYNELSRRQFVTDLTGLALMSVSLPEWVPKVVLAESADSSRDIIVSIFLRGGADGLSLCVPFGDTNYYASRSTIAIPRPDSTAANKGIALDDFWAFPQALAPLVTPFTAGDLLVVHGCGLSYVSRSHFDAQRFIEVGKAADPTIVTGWLGRHLASSTPMRTGAPLRALGLSDGLARTLEGAPLTLPIANPANFALSGASATRTDRQNFFRTDYGTASEVVKAAALNAVNTIDLLGRINFSGYQPANGANYGTSAFGTSLRSTAALIKADIGVEAVHIDLGGWDTHVQENPLTGSMFRTMSDFATGLGAFYLDVLGATQNYNVTVVAMSEFGRNVRENGSNGTDHGRGTAMFVMGHNIAGGRVLTKNWVPLARENLELQQDVPVTIDHRDVLAEIVKQRLANPNLSLIFPDFVPSFKGVTK